MYLSKQFFFIFLFFLSQTNTFATDLRISSSYPPYTPTIQQRAIGTIPTSSNYLHLNATITPPTTAKEKPLNSHMNSNSYLNENLSEQTTATLIKLYITLKKDFDLFASIIQNISRKHPAKNNLFPIIQQLLNPSNDFNINTKPISSTKNDTVLINFTIQSLLKRKDQETLIKILEGIKNKQPIVKRTVKHWFFSESLANGEFKNFISADTRERLYGLRKKISNRNNQVLIQNDLTNLINNLNATPYEVALLCLLEKNFQDNSIEKFKLVLENNKPPENYIPQNILSLLPYC